MLLIELQINRKHLSGLRHNFSPRKQTGDASAEDRKGRLYSQQARMSSSGKLRDKTGIATEERRNQPNQEK